MRGRGVGRRFTGWGEVVWDVCGCDMVGESLDLEKSKKLARMDGYVIYIELEVSGVYLCIMNDSELLLLLLIPLGS